MPNWQVRTPQHGTPKRLPQRTGQPPEDDFRVGELRAAPLIGLALSPVFTSDRLLTAGSEIEHVDGGAKGNLSFRLKTTGVAPATYGAALKVPIIQIDSKGRIVAASEAALGTAAGMDADNDVALAANSATRVPTQLAAKAYIDAKVTGVMTFKGDIDCSTNPDYPAGAKGDSYIASVAGKIGGGSGKAVDAGDLIVCRANNAGGTEVAVGASWFVLEHNLLGALLAANNLADLTNAGTARTNLGLGTAATQNTGTSGATIPLLNGANTWSAGQTISGQTGGANLVFSRRGAGLEGGQITYGYGNAVAGDWITDVDAANNFRILKSDGSGTIVAISVSPSTGAVTLGAALAGASLSTPVLSAVPSSAWGADFASASTLVAIANNGTYDLAAGSGMVALYEDGGAGAGLFMTWYGSVAIVTQNAAGFTTASGTAGKINVFYNAGTGKYRIENKTGGSIALYIGTMRMRPSA